MKMIRVLAVMAAMVSTSTAFAQAYIGAGGGVGRLNLDCGGTTTCDNSTTPAKAYLGYQFVKGWGAELAVVNFGTAKATVGTGSSTIRASMKHEAVALALRGEVPMTSSLNFVTRLGVSSNKASLSASQGSISVSDSKKTTGAYAGFGLSYTINPSMALEGVIESTSFKDPSNNDRYGAYYGGAALTIKF